MGESTDMNTGFTERAKETIKLAEGEARAHNHDYIGTEHILLGLIDQDNGVAALTLEALGVIPLAVVRREIEGIISHGRHMTAGKIPLTQQAERVLELSRQEAARLGHRTTGTEHILLGLIQVGDGIAARVLLGLGVTLLLAREQVIQFRDGRSRDVTRPRNPADFEWQRPAEKALAARARPIVLYRFGRNLTQQARDGSLYPAVGRDKEIDEVVRVLSQQTRSSPLLIGSVTGTTTVMEGLAQRIVSGRVPQELKGSHLYFCDPRQVAAEVEAYGVSDIDLRNRVIELIATLALPEDHEYGRPRKVGGLEVLAAILQEAQTHDYIILALGKLPTVAASPLLKTMLASDALRMICVASSEDSREYIREGAGFSRPLQVLHVAEPTTAYAIGKLKITLRAVAQERTATYSI